MDNTYTLYMHITPNKKYYIGITKQDVNIRWRNGNGYRYNNYFYKAIKKYKWENIEHKILFKNLSKEQAEDLEKEYIEKYKSNISKYGYNIESGGLVAPKSIKSRIKSNKTKKNIVPWNKGKKMSEEQRLKLSKIKKGKGLNDKLLNAIRIQIVCVETNKQYKSILEASNETSINVSNIAQVCKGNRKTAGGYHWKYLKGDD